MDAGKGARTRGGDSSLIACHMFFPAEWMDGWEEDQVDGVR